MRRVNFVWINGARIGGPGKGIGVGETRAIICITIHAIIAIETITVAIEAIAGGQIGIITGQR